MDNQDTRDEFNDLLDAARTLLAGDYDSCDALESNDLINVALSLRAESADAWLLKCQALSCLNDDIAALAAIEMAIRFQPRLAEAHYWRTAVLSDLNRFTEALQSVERCFRYLGNEDHWLLEDLYCEKAMVLDSLGRKDDAVDVYEEGLDQCPSSTLLQAGLAPLRRAKIRSTFQLLRGGLGSN